MNVVERRQPVKHWHREGAEAMDLDIFVIWSVEHQAWRRAAELGYCATLAIAGYYTRAAAERIVAQGNECMIPVAALAGGRDAR